MLKSVKLLIIQALLFSHVCTQASLIIESSFEANKNWTHFSKSDELNVKNLVQLLSNSPTAKDLLLRAKKSAAERGQTLTDIINVGDGSYTDTTLVRRFSARNPANVSYESRSKIFINRDHNQYHALLDLAHELTHYVERPSFDPYADNFTLEGFISSTIEGEGGEVQAFVNECKVLKELFPSQIKRHDHCFKIYRHDEDGFDYNHATINFYKVGAHWGRLKQLLKNAGVIDKLPYLSDKKESFISSVYGEPYPLAAYREYMSVMSKVCENDERRLSYLEETSSRSPASSTMVKSFKQRCASFL